MSHRPSTAVDLVLVTLALELSATAMYAHSAKQLSAVESDTALAAAVAPIFWQMRHRHCPQIDLNAHGTGTG